MQAGLYTSMLCSRPSVLGRLEEVHWKPCCLSYISQSIVVTYIFCDACCYLVLKSSDLLQWKFLRLSFTNVLFFFFFLVLYSYRLPRIVSVVLVFNFIKEFSVTPETSENVGTSVKGQQTYAISYCLKGYFSQKWRFCHCLLILMLTQTCMAYICL